MAPQIRARKPTGRVPYPLVLVEGGEKSGKSWAAALLSSSPRVGQTYWLDLGEGGADEYGAIPKTRFLVLEHDGTYAQILDQIHAVKAEAARAKAAGEPPVVLVIDSITDLWTGLKTWVDERYRRTETAKAKLRKDPDAELKPTQNLWNDANTRHRRVMTQLMTFPGIVIVTARGKEVTEVKNGKPVEGAKVWAVEAQKDVPFDATLWLRMFRDQRPMVIGARSVHAGIRPGEEPQPIEEDHDNLLDWVIFDVLKVDPDDVAVRDLQHTTGGDLTDDERVDEPESQQQGRGSPTLRAMAEAAAKQASQASDVDMLATAGEALPKGGMNQDVSRALASEERATAGRVTGDQRLTTAPTVPLSVWIWACGKCIAKEQLSLRDATALANPEPAQRELATTP